MARDGSETRARLLVEAERLFAEVGVWQAATGAIVRAAGQRNASALTYHFGSRQGVLDAILADHGNPIAAHRGALLAKISTDAPDIRVLVDALVRPMTEVLDDPGGRRYVRIVSQLSDQFPAWREAPTGVDQTHLLLGKSAKGARQPFLYRDNGIRRGKWKYLKAKHNVYGYARDRKRKELEELYNLDADIGETKNLAARHPGKVQQLRATLDTWWAGPESAP